MFIYDRPIELEKDDFLGRTNFSKELGKSLQNWEEKESLVIAIYGEWGSGKSSIINLAKNSINDSEKKDKPTVIEFNPWMYSDLNGLTKNFFAELGKQLKIKGDAGKDQQIADKLAYYASVLNLLPEKETVVGLGSKILLGFGLLGLSFPQIAGLLNISNEIIKWSVFGFGFLFILTQIFQGLLSRLSAVFEKRATYKSKSVFEIKEEIKVALEKRNKKLLIIIDDIDRLNTTEMREIFRLIRANADFPNTIYLLAFDRKIVEANLAEQSGISGKDYLEKIVQVNFDVPYAKPSKIQSYLFKELDRILDKLPKQAQEFFKEDDPYWTNVYYSGLKDFFKNIRDVKRFVSGLEFNISQIHQKDILEVNPIDFIAIEGIRIFAPSFYYFMKGRNELFTSTDRESGHRDNNPRKIELEAGLNECPQEYRNFVTELVRRLFPQVDGVMQYGYSTHGHDWQSSWSKKLKVCSTNHFDSYFTLIPGGDETELSQHEIASILSSFDKAEDFEAILRYYIENKKIRKVLQRLQDYTDDNEKMPLEKAQNIIQALFNIADDLPQEKAGMFDFGSDMEIMRIIYQLFKRQSDKVKNFETLKAVIPTSGELFGFVQKVSLESSRKEKEAREEEYSVPKDKIEELQSIALTRIKELEDKLLQNKKLLYILYRWKEWDKESTYKNFINKIISDDEKLLTFLEMFISYSSSISMGDYGSKRKKEFNYKSLEDFEILDQVKSKVETIKTQKLELYSRHKETADFFLDNFDNRNKGGF